MKSEHLAQGLGTFVVARADGEAVGCGALRRLDDTTGELKRMFVEPELRGRGIAKQVLASLESTARELGISRLMLETGVYQSEAIALYTGAGFSPIPCCGEYAGTRTSVCFEKKL